MELKQVALEIFKAKSSLQLKGINVDMYLFGSILKNDSLYSDIDILSIYQRDNEVKFIREKLNDLSLKVPLDICFMTKQEEAELNFIARTQAVNIDCAVAT